MERKTFLLVVLLSAGISILWTLARPGQKEEPVYDIIIKNGKVLDGSLKPETISDVAIKGDRIIKVAKSITGEANRVINAKGLYVTPGFIDLHFQPPRVQSGSPILAHQRRACPG
jgi:ribosomal protein S16